VEIEIPVEFMEQEEFKGEITAGQDKQIPNDPSSAESPLSKVTNHPSNQGNFARQDQFFDAEYEKEIKAARELSSDVNKQLSKEIIDIDNIEMPEDNTMGMKEEDIKNVVYSGESNIEYHLGNRYHLRLPIPVYLAKGGGVVIVDISVNREGHVIFSKARPNKAVTDEQIFLYSQIAAQRTFFNADKTAPAVQNGTIRYTFIPQ
jgi:hypothetical protein